jgi:hypothetical protein
MIRTHVLVAVALLAGCARPVRHAPTPVTPVAADAPIVPAATGFRYEPGHLVAVVGRDVSVMPAEPPPGAVRADPPLPAGLTLDPVTGRISGRVAQPSAGQLHLLRDDSGAPVAGFHVEVVVAPGGARDRFVSLAGDDQAAGDEAHPFRTIGHAVASATPGTTIYVREGRYVETVRVGNVHGQPGQPVVLRSYPGERVVIDGGLPGPIAWRRATGPGAAPDEWVADVGGDGGKRGEAVNRGAFVDRVPYTRLLTYSRLEDLRSANHLWWRDGSRPGPTTVRGDKKPWTYFGPGLWFDAANGRVHLRLSPTAHGWPGYAEYRGPGDPAAATVTISRREQRALTIQGSSFVEVRDLELVGGGDETVRLEKADDIVLDHVEIRGTTIGLMIASTTRARVLHSRIDGGVPPWTFRSDYKDDYKFELPGQGVVVSRLINKTQRALLHVGPNNRQLEIGYCELENGHDVYMAGVDSELHHCVIRNLHDEALFISHTPDIGNLRIHDNLVAQVLSGVSGAGNRASGPRFIYRNVFDLRAPTAGYRPDGHGRDPRRWGHLFKGNVAAAPLYFYQNTILARPGGQAALLHFRQLERDGVVLHPRWFLNNVIVAEVVDDASDRALSFVPEDQYLDQRSAAGEPLLRSDGNLWVRPAGMRAPMFRCLTLVKGRRCPKGGYTDMSSLPGGFEAHSRVVEIDDAPAAPRAGLATNARASARGKAAEGAATGVPLPAALPDTAGAKPGAGAGEGPARGGVDGRIGY